MSDNQHPGKLILLLEKQLLSFASENNAKAMLRKYSIHMDDESMKKAMVIWSTEFRQLLERWRASLPEDTVEAQAFIAKKKAPRGSNKTQS